MAAKEEKFSHSADTSAERQGEETAPSFGKHSSGKSDLSEDSSQVSDNLQSTKTGEPTNDMDHSTLIRKNYVTLVNELQPQLFLPQLPPYLWETIDEDMRKKEKSRALLDLLMRSPKDNFDQFCKVIAGLHPNLFELLKERKPTRVETETYLRHFCDKLWQGIMCTGSKTDNEVDKEFKIDLDTQFVSLKLTDIRVKNSPRTYLKNEDNVIPNRYQYNLLQMHKTDIDAKNILPEQPAGKDILITGRAGIGKSTLIQFLNRQWAKEQWAKSHTAAFLLNLRKLADIQREVTLSQLLGLYAEYVPVPLDQLQPAVQWLENNEEKVLVFTDGIDELADLSRLWRDTGKLATDIEGTPLEWCINLMRRDILKNSTLLMISRPFEGLKDIEPDVHIDVLGLVPEKVMQFIELNVQKERQKVVKETLEKNPFLLSVCSITFYCAAISKILEEDERVDVSELTTYTRITAFIISRLAATRGINKTVPSVFSDSMFKCLPRMAALAFRGLSEVHDNVTKLIFRERDFIDSRFSQEKIEEALHSGLLTCQNVNDPLDESKSKTLQAEFLHLSVQELFAAAQMLKTDTHIVEKYVSDVLDSGILNMCQLFLFGLALDHEDKYIAGIKQGVMTEAESVHVNQHKDDLQVLLLKYFQLQCNKRGYSNTGVLEMVQTAYESQRPELARLLIPVVAVDGVMRPRLWAQHLTAVDMKAILFVFQHTQAWMLKFCNITIDNASAWEINKHLSKHTHLISLNLENNNLSEEAMKSVFEAVKTSKSLKKLVFTEKNITLECMKCLADAVNTSTSMNILRLRKPVFMEMDMELLCPAIRTKLKKLWFSADRIDTQAMSILSNAVSVSTSMNTLCLRVTEIPDEGRELIENAVQGNSMLPNLYIDNRFQNVHMESVFSEPAE